LQGFDVGETHRSQPRQASTTEEVAELRGNFADVELPVDEDMDTVLKTIVRTRTKNIR